MTDPLDSDRLRFFLRHRDDIKEWASIERELNTATRELLGLLLPDIAARLLEFDPAVAVARLDDRSHERIHARHAGWASGVGMTLEWENGVDPFGGSLPKFGLFFLNGAPENAAAKARIVERMRASQELRVAGYRPGDGYWPIVKFVPKSSAWWQDPAAWTAPITDSLVALWPRVAPVIDEAFTAPAA